MKSFKFFPKSKNITFGLCLTILSLFSPLVLAQNIEGCLVEAENNKLQCESNALMWFAQELQDECDWTARSVELKVFGSGISIGSSQYCALSLQSIHQADLNRCQGINNSDVYKCKEKYSQDEDENDSEDDSASGSSTYQPSITVPTMTSYAAYSAHLTMLMSFSNGRVTSYCPNGPC